MAQEVTTDRSGSFNPALGFASASVLAWMREVGVPVHGALRFRRIGQGKSNLTFEVTDEAEGRWVLRRPPLGELLASAHDVVREAGILAAVGRSAVPVPAVLGVCEDTAVSPAPLVLMEHVDGVVVDRMSRAEALDPDQRRSLSDSLVRTLVSIHGVDLEATGLTGLARHGDYAERQLRRWSAQWDGARTRELPALDALTEILKGSVPSQTETALVHGDYHVRNVITVPGGGGVRAVLDWELATLGDPLADLGSFLAYWPERDDPPTGLFSASSLPGFRTRDDLVAAYLDATGRDGSAVAFWHVLGLWKVAIIVEGVLRRTRNDPRNADGETLAPEMVDRLVDRAHATWAARER